MNLKINSIDEEILKKITEEYEVESLEIVNLNGDIEYFSANSLKNLVIDSETIFVEFERNSPKAYLTYGLPYLISFKRKEKYEQIQDKIR